MRPQKRSTTTTQNPFREDKRRCVVHRRQHHHLALIIVVVALVLFVALLVYFFQRTRIQESNRGNNLERYCYGQERLVVQTENADKINSDDKKIDELFMTSLKERFGGGMLDPNRSGAIRVLVVEANVQRRLEALRRDGRFEVDGLEPCPNLYQSLEEESRGEFFEFLGNNLGFSDNKVKRRGRGRAASRVWNTDLAKFVHAVKTDYLFAMDDVGQYHGVSICDNGAGGAGAGLLLHDNILLKDVVDHLLVEGGLLLTCLKSKSQQTDHNDDDNDFITSIQSKRTDNHFRVIRTHELSGDGDGDRADEGRTTMLISGVDMKDPHIGRPLKLPQILRYHHECSHHDKRHNAVSGKVRKWKDQPEKFLLLDGAGGGGGKAEVVPLKLTNYWESESESKRIAVDVDECGIKKLDVSRFLQDAFGITAWKGRGNSRWSVRSHPSSGGLQTAEVYILGADLAKTTINGSSAPYRSLWHYNSFWHALQKRGDVPQSVWERTFGRVAKVAAKGKDDCSSIVFVAFTSIYWRNSWKYGEPGFWKGNLDAGHAMGSAAAAARVQGFRALVVERVDDDFLSEILGLDKVSDGQVKCKSSRFRVNAQHPVGLLAILPKDDETGGVSELEMAIASMDFVSGGGIMTKTNFIHEDEALNPIPSTTERVADGYCGSYKSRGNALTVQTTSHDRQNYGSFWEEKTRMPLSKAIIERRTAKTYSLERSLMRLDDFLDLISCLKTGCGIAPHFPWKPAVHVLLFVHAVDGIEPGLYLLDRSTTPGPSGPSSRLHEALRYALPNIDRNKPRLVYDVVKGGLKSHKDLGNSFFFVEGGFDTRRVAQLLSREQEIARDDTFTVSFLGDLDHSLLRKSPHWYRYVHWEAAALGHQLYLMAETLGFRGSGIGSFYSSMVRHFAFGDAGFSSENVPYLPVYHFTFGKADFDDRIHKHEPYSFLEKLRADDGDNKAMMTTVGY